MPLDTAAWTTLANAKEQLHIASTDTTRDDFLTNLINRAYKICEHYLSRKIKQATYTEYYDGDGTSELILNQWPIISVTSIHDDLDRDFTSTTLVSADDYILYKERGIIKLAGSDLAEAATFQAGHQNLKVVYSAGYATVPADLEDACLQQVEHMFNRSATGGFTGGSMGGRSESYDQSRLSPQVLRVLQGYKKYGHGSYST